MTKPTTALHVSYAAGDAWCLVTRDVVAVFDRELGAKAALALRERVIEREALGEVSTELVLDLLHGDTHALAVFARHTTSWSIARRQGVPARSARDGELAAHFGGSWGLDRVHAGDELAFGALDQVEQAILPIDGGIVRVCAVVAATSFADTDALASPIDEATVASAPGTTAFTRQGFDAPSFATQQQPEHPVTPEPSAPLVPAVPPVPAEPSVPSDPAATTAPTRTAPEPDEPQLGGLIDSVPGFIRPASSVVPPASSPLGDAAGAEREGPTASATPSASAEPHAAAQSAVPADDGLGDHDGLTINRDAVPPVAAQAPQPIVPAEAPATGPLVLSTLCAAGHVNPPGSERCSVCELAIDGGSSGQRHRPEYAAVVLQHGERVPLGRGVVLGRRPRSRRIEDGRVPRLVSVESPHEDISRTHLEVRLDDWNIVAVDLGSTNGTVLHRDGIASQRLRPDAATILQFGDRLDLGDGVVVAIEPFSASNGEAS